MVLAEFHETHETREKGEKLKRSKDEKRPQASTGGMHEQLVGRNLNPLGQPSYVCIALFLYIHGCEPGGIIGQSSAFYL
jgi:hypothetical protein